MVRHTQDDVDAAVVPMPFARKDFERLDFRALPLWRFPTDAELKQLSIGDDIVRRECSLIFQQQVEITPFSSSARSRISPVRTCRHLSRAHCAAVIRKKRGRAYHASRRTGYLIEFALHRTGAHLCHGYACSRKVGA